MSDFSMKLLAAFATAVSATSFQIPIMNSQIKASPGRSYSFATTSADYLILGQGFIGSYFVEHLKELEIESYIGTTRDGRDGTLKWSSTDPCSQLPPDPRHVLITFPLDTQTLDRLLPCFPSHTKWILLGSTRPFKAPGRNTRLTPPEPSPRGLAEEALLKSPVHALVLNLAGLYGGKRQPKDWIHRVASSLEACRALQSLHLIHGRDVARVIWYAFNHADTTGRFIVTDGRVYDWWDVILKLALAGDHVRDWVSDAMQESGVAHLPRPKESFDRYLDSQDLWNKLQIQPKESPFEV